MRSRSIYAARAAALAGLSAVLSACGGGGAGGAGPSVSVGFTGPSSAAPEGAATSVELTLSASNGMTNADLTVTVRDLGTGTAQAGSDHDFTADQVITFPAGSLDGDTRSVVVTSYADNSIEGLDETLALRLYDVIGGSYQGRNHTHTIGDGDQAELAFVIASSSTLDEATPLGVDLELRLDPGETLDVDVNATLSDLGSGSSSSGVDYASVGNPTFTFPAGSIHQSRQTAILVPLDDLLVEGDETVDLGLANPSAGAGIANGTHVVTITDDDGLGEAFLTVSGSLFGAAPSSVSYGDDFDLGSAALNSGPNQALALTVQNTGAVTLDLPPIVISGDTSDFSVELDVSQAALASPAFAAASFPFTTQASEPARGSILTPVAEDRASLQQAERVVMTGVELPGGGELELELERVELPFAADALILVDRRPVTVDELVGDLMLWKGTALGYPESQAFLAFSGQGSHGWIDMGQGLGTLNLVTETTSGSAVVHWMWQDQLQAAYTGAVPGYCDAGLPVPTAAAAHVPPISSMAVTLGTSECRLAIETDYQFYSIFGDVVAATQYATQLVAAVSQVYEQEVQADLEIAYLGIYTSSNDPWSEPEAPGATPSTLLSEFRSAWAGNWPVSADLAHFVSGAPLGGGVAYVGALCNQSFGFGVSASISGAINWGGFTGAPSVSNWDFVVLAHELGHNFGALHTHDYCPPLDQCYSNCNGSTTCTQGTIMSYCHVCGGMANLRLRFHPFVAQEIRDEISTSCLSTAALPPGGSLSLTISLEPTSSPGAVAAQLDLYHSAPNESTPFRIDLIGNVTN